ncbi:hypothetical protein HDU98_007875, partial [Podochytrium sp. JEL0797]
MGFVMQKLNELEEMRAKHHHQLAALKDEFRMYLDDEGATETSFKLEKLRLEYKTVGDRKLFQNRLDAEFPQWSKSELKTQLMWRDKNGGYKSRLTALHKNYQTQVSEFIKACIHQFPIASKQHLAKLQADHDQAAVLEKMQEAHDKLSAWRKQRIQDLEREEEIRQFELTQMESANEEKEAERRRELESKQAAIREFQIQKRAKQMQLIHEYESKQQEQSVKLAELKPKLEHKKQEQQDREEQRREIERKLDLLRSTVSVTAEPDWNRILRPTKSFQVSRDTEKLTITELRNATAIPVDSLRSQNMPPDPTFLDKPVRDYLLRFLVIVPIMTVPPLVFAFITFQSIGKPSKGDLLLDSVDTFFCFISSAWGWYAIQRMIPERIIIFGYLYLLRNVIHIIWSLVVLFGALGGVVNPVSDSTLQNDVNEKAGQMELGIFVGFVVFAVGPMNAGMILLKMSKGLHPNQKKISFGPEGLRSRISPASSIQDVRITFHHAAYHVPETAELKTAEALPPDTLTLPGMPSDPVFLDKPIRGYMMRYLTVIPVVAVINVIIDLLLDHSIIGAPLTIWNLTEAIAGTVFSVFGWYAMKGLIVEWITLFSYYYMFRCCTTIAWVSYMIWSVVTSQQNGTEIGVGVILLVALTGASVVVIYVIVVKMAIPLRMYAEECRMVRRTGR